MVYENISRLCEKRNISIKQLERKAGLKNGAIGKWRNHSPTLKSLQMVASVLGVSVFTLIREVEKDKKEVEEDENKR